MTTTPANPFHTLSALIEQASPASAVISALACVRRASAVLEAADVRVGGDAPFGGGSIAALDVRADPAVWVAPVLRAQGVLAEFVADPETGELPGGEESDGAQLLEYVAEMVVRAGIDEETLRAWPGWCSALALDTCQHLDTVDGPGPDPQDGEVDIPGPLTVAELQTQLDILALLAGGSPDVLDRVSAVAEAARAGVLVAASRVFGAA